MFGMVISVLTPIAVSYMPRLSELNLKKDIEGFTKALNRLLGVTIFISVPAALAFYYYSFDLLDTLFSSHSSAISAELLACLSFGVCMLSTLTVINTALESQGRISATVISLLLGCLIKLSASYILIGRSSLGILGAPLGTVLSYVVSFVVSLLALDGTGIRTRPVFKMGVLFSSGLLAFYFPYKAIYCTSILGSGFLSMMLALSVSFIIYSSIAGFYYFVVTRNVKMHKKEVLRLDEYTKLERIS